MAHQVIGIDASASGIKTAVLEASLRSLEFKRVRLHAWPTGGDTTMMAGAGLGDDGKPRSGTAFVAKAAANAIREDGATSADPYIAFDGQKTSTRVMKFPIGDLRKVEAILEPELEDQLPRPLDEIAYSYTPLTIARDKCELLVATVDRADLRTLIDALAASRCAPRAVFAESLALLSLAAAIGPADAQTGTIIDIGHTKAHVMHMARGRPLFARTVREGGQKLDQAIARTLGLSEEEAQRKKEAGRVLLPHEGAPSEVEAKLSSALVAALRPFVIAVKQTMHLHREALQGGKVYLTGGGSQLGGLTQYLALELGVPVELLPLPEALTRVPEAHRYTLAYGLAATGTAPLRHPKLDFRRGEFSFRGDLTNLRNESGKLGWIALAIVLLAIVSGLSRYIVLSSDERQLDNTLKVVTKQMMGREIGNFQQAMAAIKQSSSPDKGPMPRFSALDYFAIVSQRVPATIDAKMLELDFRQDKVLLRGEAASTTAAQDIVDALKGHECFRDVKLSKSKKIDGARVEFNVTIDLSCGGA
ncbi:MAG: pilus assembly protein PilM [Deltaproteobacteria bacterium]|nr:pilus assembly protein PilM [Deltaproteobacteria bacterium]